MMSKRMTGAAAAAGLGAVVLVGTFAANASAQSARCEALSSVIISSEC